MALPPGPRIVIVRLGLAKETSVSKLIGVHAAKTTLSRLIEQAAAGEDIVITRYGEPVARLIPRRAGAAPPIRNAPGSRKGRS